jgi:hypothetical protein
MSEYLQRLWFYDGDQSTCDYVDGGAFDKGSSLYILWNFREVRRGMYISHS